MAEKEVKPRDWGRRNMIQTETTFTGIIQGYLPKTRRVEIMPVEVPPGLLHQQFTHLPPTPRAFAVQTPPEQNLNLILNSPTQIIARMNAHSIWDNENDMPMTIYEWVIVDVPDCPEAGVIGNNEDR